MMMDYQRTGLVGVWLNPPFNRYQIYSWFEKMALHGNGILLTGAACETGRFKKYVWPYASGILFLDHRPYFVDEKGNKGKHGSGQTICLVSYGDANYESLLKSGLGTTLKV